MRAHVEKVDVLGWNKSPGINRKSLPSVGRMQQSGAAPPVNNPTWNNFLYKGGTILVYPPLALQVCWVDPFPYGPSISQLGQYS